MEMVRCGVYVVLAHFSFIKDKNLQRVQICGMVLVHIEQMSHLRLV